MFTEGTPGVEIIPSLQPGPGEVTVTKQRYSAFVNTDLESILRGNGIDTVVISGLMTQYCSVTTARHAHDLDYRVIFVSDANAGPDLPDLGFGEARRGCGSFLWRSGSLGRDDAALRYSHDGRTEPSLCPCRRGARRVHVPETSSNAISRVEDAEYELKRQWIDRALAGFERKPGVGHVVSVNMNMV